MKKSVCLSGLMALSLLTGCSWMSGLIDATDQFGCPIQSGLSCTSLSETHARVKDELEIKDEKRLRTAVAPSLSNVSETVSTDAVNDSARTEPLKKVLSKDQSQPQLKLHPIRQKQEGAIDSETPGESARLAERIVMLWVLPWVDEQADLHGEERIWMRVKEARWGVERLRAEAMKRGIPGVEP